MEIYECQDKAVSSMEIINYFTASLLRDLNKVTYIGVPICLFISPRIVLFTECMNRLHDSQLRCLLKMWVLSPQPGLLSQNTYEGRSTKLHL